MTTVALASLVGITSVGAFVPLPQTPSFLPRFFHPAPLTMVATSSQKKGMGMGGGAGTGMGKKSGNKSKRRRTAAASASVPFDAAAAYNRSEKRYDELIAEADASDPDGPYGGLMAREYMIVAQQTGTVGAGASSLFDWTPAAHLVLVGADSLSDPTTAAERGVSSLKREIHHALVTGIPSAASLPRSEVRYALEPLRDFMEYVFDAVIADKASDGDEKPMSKAEARRILGLESDSDASTVKRAYRKITLAYHPDRFAASGEEEPEEAAEKFQAGTRAYETLGGGMGATVEGSSWYESLGGRARTEFSGPLILGKAGVAGALEGAPFEAGGYKVAVSAVDPEITMMFIARNQAAAAAARGLTANLEVAEK